MHFHTLLTTLLTTLASAEVLHPAILIARGGVDFIARQAAPSTKTDDYSAACTGIKSILDFQPTAAADVLNWGLGVGPLTVPCLTIPTSITDNFNSFTSAVSSWWSIHDVELHKSAVDCPHVVRGLSSVLSAITNDCSNSSQTVSPGKSGNSGHKNGVMVGAAVAAAGILGVVAAL